MVSASCSRSLCSGPAFASDHSEIHEKHKIKISQWTSISVISGRTPTSLAVRRRDAHAIFYNIGHRSHCASVCPAGLCTEHYRYERSDGPSPDQCVAEHHRRKGRPNPQFDHHRLYSGWSRAAADITPPFPEQQQQALRDAFITDGNTPAKLLTGSAANLKKPIIL
jgi:hypothetical protein